MHRIRLLVVLSFAALLLAAPAAPSSSSGVVVSQVFAGGGNAGASFDHDFVELFNTGSSSISLNDWTVQYASAASTSWQTTILAGSIPGHGYFLVQLNSAAAVGAAHSGARRRRHHEHGRLRRKGRPRHDLDGAHLRQRRPGAARPRAASTTSSATARRPRTRARRQHPR